VALSRCTSLEGIKLRTPIKLSDIIVRDEVIRLSQTANNETAISNELSDSQANYYYKNCINEFDNNNFELAYDNLIKAKEFRDDTLKPIFKRFLSFKLNQLKLKNNKFKNLEKANSKLVSEIEQLNEKLRTKDLQLKEISKELSENQKEMENLYRVVDVKEREERSTASQLHANLKELAVQKKQTNIATQTNNENLIRIENANQITANLQEEKNNLKSEISNWKKYTVIAVITLFVILILLIIKLVSS
jgi:chromosome segregation ATPase